MLRTIESIVESHQKATRRREAGLNIWDRKLSIKHFLSASEDSADIEEASRGIGSTIRHSSWMKLRKDDYDFEMMVMELEEGVEDVEAFNYILSNLYDEADYDRVWIS